MYVTAGMVIILVSAMASLQSIVFTQKNDLYAYLRIVGLVIGFIVVVYGLQRLRIERSDPRKEGPAGGSR